MKLRRLFTRRRLKWAGLVASMLIATALVGSRWCKTGYFRETPTSLLWISIESGRITACQVRVREEGVFGSDYSELYFHSLPVADHRVEGKRKLEFTFDWGKNLFRNTSSFGRQVTTWLYIPLWAPFMLFALPTAWLCWTDRKVPPGYCPHCRYDLAGLIVGSENGPTVCPECGKATERKA